MIITRRALLHIVSGALLGLALISSSSSSARARGKPQIGVVVKIGGIPWFNAMEVGIKKVAPEVGADAWMVGPTQADAAQQVRAVEDLIARKVDVIAVVPNDAKALEPVFKRAKEAGIKIITHESPDQQFNDWNVELTTAEGFGERHMESLATAVGGEGKYIVYVGSLTVPLHNKWADAAIALQKSKYPKMKLVADRFGVAESVDESYKTTLDMMRANPDLKGVLAFGSQGPIGAARAVDDRGKIGKVFVFGPIYFSGGKSIYTLPDWWATRVVFFETETEGGLTRLTLPVVVMCAVISMTWVLMGKLSAGRQLYALGGNPEAARRLGINVAVMHVLAYGYLGLMAAVAGLVQAHRVGESVPNAMVGSELNVLAAAVLGGASLSGGIGTVSGVLLGILLLAVLQNGLNLLGVSPYFFQIVTGLVILVGTSTTALSSKQMNLLDRASPSLALGSSSAYSVLGGAAVCARQALTGGCTRTARASERERWDAVTRWQIEARRSALGAHDVERGTRSRCPRRIVKTPTRSAVPH